MRRNSLGNHCPVRHAFDNPLGRTPGEAYGIVGAQMKFEQLLGPGRQRHHSSLAPVTVPAAFAPDNQSVLLPMNLVALQAAELTDPQARIEQPPDNQLLLKRPTRVYQLVALLSVQRLAYKDVTHA